MGRIRGCIGSLITPTGAGPWTPGNLGPFTPQPGSPPPLCTPHKRLTRKSVNARDVCVIGVQTSFPISIMI